MSIWCYLDCRHFHQRCILYCCVVNTPHAALCATSAGPQVLLCIRMIDDLLRSEDANYKMAPKPEVTCRFYVLPEMIGPAIIGKAGTHAKHIRERTGVRIEVVGEWAAAAGGCVCVGSGARVGGLRIGWEGGCACVRIEVVGEWTLLLGQGRGMHREHQGCGRVCRKSCVWYVWYVRYSNTVCVFAEPRQQLLLAAIAPTCHAKVMVPIILPCITCPPPTTSP